LTVNHNPGITIYDYFEVFAQRRGVKHTYLLEFILTRFKKIL
jgi:hypothetical protein